MWLDKLLSEHLPRQVFEVKSGKTWDVLQLDKNTVKLSNSDDCFLMAIGFFDYDLKEGRFNVVSESKS
jgi:hypothetical protein